MEITPHKVLNRPMQVEFSSRPIQGNTGFEFCASTAYKGNLVIVAFQDVNAQSPNYTKEIQDEMVKSIREAIVKYDKDNPDNQTNL